MKKTYRIRGYHGGLGDQLQFSTLPEILSKQGHDVYLLKDVSGQVQPIRNEEINDFVWRSNPYIKGEIQGHWNAGDLPNAYCNKHNDFIKNWEASMFVEPQNSLPKIYDEPKMISGVEGLIDLSCTSLTYNNPLVQKRVHEIVSQFPNIRFEVLTSKYQTKTVPIFGHKELKYRDLFHAYSLLCSCKIFISLNSGLHSVAAAARRKNKMMLHYCINQTDFHASSMLSKIFIYKC